MKKILTIAAFGHDVREITNERSASFVRAFKNKGYQIIHISSDFDHAHKDYIDLEAEENVNGLVVKHLHVLSYKKNLSIKRIISHIQFAYKLRKYLNSLSELPDYIYCVTPTSSSAYVAGKFCKKKKIPFIIDIIDVWPDSLIPIYKTKLISILTSPWSYISHKGYKMADFICGESIKYAEHVHNYNPSAPWMPIYLGVNKGKINKLIDSSSIKIPSRTADIRLCYGGDLGNSYGFEGILNALVYIQEKGINYEMFFVGCGDKESYIKDFATKHHLNVMITGKLPYGDYLKYLSTCDIAFNSFVSNTKVVHSYKFNDYMATNNFVMNNLKGETADMVDKYKIGMNYTDDRSGEILYEVCNNWDTYKTYRGNVPWYVSEVLDADIIYPKAIREIEKLKI